MGGSARAGTISGANRFVENSLIGIGVGFVDDFLGVVASPAANGAENIHNVINKNR